MKSPLTLHLTRESTRGYDKSEKCSQCNKLLSKRYHAWLGYYGTFCTVRCANEHEEKRKNLKK